MRKTTPENKYIHLIDSYNSKCWRVGIWALRDHPIDAQVYFTFKTHGGKRKAFKAAQLWRNKRLNSLGLSSLLKPKHIVQNQRTRHSGNRSGVIGVGITFSYSSPDKVPRHPSWTARYMKHGKQITRGYSIGKYGNEQAFMMACLMRSFKVGELSVVDTSVLPVTLRRLKSFLKDTVASEKILVGHS